MIWRDFIFKVLSLYSIHVITEYNLSVSKIICHQIDVIFLYCLFSAFYVFSFPNWEAKFKHLSVRVFLLLYHQQTILAASF